MSELKPEDKKLHKALSKAMTDEDFYDTILEAAQAKRIKQLQDALKRIGLCSGCGCTAKRCKDWQKGGAIACCPECNHKHGLEEALKGE